MFTCAGSAKSKSFVFLDNRSPDYRSIDIEKFCVDPSHYIQRLRCANYLAIISLHLHSEDQSSHQTNYNIGRRLVHLEELRLSSIP